MNWWGGLKVKLISMSDKETVKYSITNGSIVRVALFGALILALYYLRDLVLVILTSIIIASFMDAAARRLKKIRMNRTLAIILLYIVVIGIVAGLVYLFIPILVKEASNLLNLLSKYIAPTKVLNQLSNNTFTDVQTIASNFSKGSFFATVTNVKGMISNISTNFIQVAGGAFGGFVNLLLIVVISFYLSIEEHGIEKFLRIIIPAKSEEYVIDLWKRSQRKIALWVKGQMLLGIIVGVFTYLLLLLFGVKYALILALLAAVCELVPFGIYLAAVPALSFSYLDGGITLMLTVLIIYSVIHMLEIYMFQPLILRRVIGISPLVVILSVLIGAKLLGFWGVVIAIPVAVSLLEFFDDVEKKKIALRE